MSDRKLKVQAFYADTDAGGVVYHSRYLEYFERARWDVFESIGFPLNGLLEQGVVFAVVAAELNFRNPGRLGDVIEISTRVEHVGGASLGFRHVARRAKDNTVLCEGGIRLACLREDWKVSPLPESLRRGLCGFSGKAGASGISN